MTQPINMTDVYIVYVILYLLFGLAVFGHRNIETIKLRESLIFGLGSAIQFIGLYFMK